MHGAWESVSLTLTHPRRVSHRRVIQAFSLVEDVSGLYRKQLERPTRDSIRAAQIR